MNIVSLGWPDFLKLKPGRLACECSEQNEDVWSPYIGWLASKLATKAWLSLSVSPWRGSWLIVSDFNSAFMIGSKKKKNCNQISLRISWVSTVMCHKTIHEVSREYSTKGNVLSCFLHGQSSCLVMRLWKMWLRNVWLYFFLYVDLKKPHFCGWRGNRKVGSSFSAAY